MTPNALKPAVTAIGNTVTPRNITIGYPYIGTTGAVLLLGVAFGYVPTSYLPLAMGLLLMPLVILFVILGLALVAALAVAVFFAVLYALIGVLWVLSKIESVIRNSAWVRRRRQARFKAYVQQGRR